MKCYLPALICVLLIPSPGAAADKPPRFPADPLTPEITQSELSTHLHYLAHPDRRGRKGNDQSMCDVRDYLAGRFAAARLRPWGQSQDFRQIFADGVNIVGLIPGADPEQARQIVLVCAHYDHVGLEQGQVFPGAGENGAGTTAVIELAEHFALAPPPRRTMVFALFDAEEIGLKGSHAFAHRADFDPNHIVMVVNIDMLGRKCLDTFNWLGILGVDNAPEVRKLFGELNQKSKIALVPLKASIMPEGSDHETFAKIKLPWIMFSCGPFKEYHTPADTADRIEYDLLWYSVDLIRQIVNSLANP